VKERLAAEREKRNIFTVKESFRTSSPRSGRVEGGNGQTAYQIPFGPKIGIFGPETLLKKGGRGSL